MTATSTDEVLNIKGPPVPLPFNLAMSMSQMCEGRAGHPVGEFTPNIFYFSSA